MMRWVDEIANRERIEELFFRKEIFLIRWFDHLIWSIDFCLITSSFNSSCISDSTSNRICLFETIRIVNFFINLLTSNWVVLWSFSRDKLFKSRWFLSSAKPKTAGKIPFWLIRLALTDETDTDWRNWHSLRKITFD